MLRSLVGSEMCIRDSGVHVHAVLLQPPLDLHPSADPASEHSHLVWLCVPGYHQFGCHRSHQLGLPSPWKPHHPAHAQMRELAQYRVPGHRSPSALMALEVTGTKCSVSCTVSYTHLTLPTKRIVKISVVAVSLTKK
eukprot:TRINITY_DN21952_c0_g1_i1.p1 TRINITY_DN21952_c0_g1~~TRINITY_DN21952_c0_g1_i1.p1  ORF type:complete len:155 (+),score=35.95 TRINITY_DN21952_c0_g1_i1:55-465(+)